MKVVGRPPRPDMKRLLLALSNVLAVVVLLALLAGAGWAAWRVLPAPAKQVLRDPQGLLDSARRGLESGPANPITVLLDRLSQWLADRADRTDIVRAADGTSDGIVPLPPWTTVDERHVFGATETIWQSRRAKLAGVRWSRVVFSWADVQPRSPRDWRARFYLRDDLIRRELNDGIELVGLLMNTPAWAAAQPANGIRSVPAGLDRPLDDPQNVWAAFVRRMARDYRGRIDTWIIWNEPDIRPGEPNAQYYTWAGDERDYTRLLRVAYLAAKQGNPKARVLFASTTYWADANAGRPLFLERVLSVLETDPEAAAHGYYFDAVGLNLYTSPDDLYRVAGIYRDVLAHHGLGKPLWLTETNAMPYDDPGQPREPNGLRVTLDQQASFVIQAFALGLAAGYERLAFHSVMDRDTRDELWGLVRNDGSLRPAFVAYQTATRYLAGAQRVVFAGRERPEWRWPPGGYLPNWQVYLVVVERSGDASPPPTPLASGTPGAAAAQAASPVPAGRAMPFPSPTTVAARQSGGAVQRISVLWNGDPEPHEVLLPRLSTDAALVDKYGRLLPLQSDGDRWRITLAGATAHSPLDPEGYYFIGGDPVLLVEQGMPAGAPATAPELA